jgi:hypothetical protein
MPFTGNPNDILEVTPKKVCAGGVRPLHTPFLGMLPHNFEFKQCMTKAKMKTNRVSMNINCGLSCLFIAWLGDYVER